MLEIVGSGGLSGARVANPLHILVSWALKFTVQTAISGGVTVQWILTGSGRRLPDAPSLLFEQAPLLYL